VNLSIPRLVVLDTATINYLADKPNDPGSKELISILSSGDWIPFLTLNVLEEIACHENDAVFQRRFNSLCRFPFVACLQNSQHEALVGSSRDLRVCEVDFLAENPNATHDEIIRTLRPKVNSGFYSGTKIVTENREWWQFFRKNLAEISRRNKSEAANLSHFTIADMDEPIPAKGEPFPKRSRQDAAVFMSQKAKWLERKVREDGDPRHIDRVTITEFVKDIWEGAQKFLTAEGDVVEEWLKQGRVDRSRLPAKATTEDFVYEGAFAMWMDSHTKFLVGDKKERMRSIRKEQLPSLVIWQELDRRIRRMPKAELGNVADRHIASFVPYIDLINVDKRIAEIFRQLNKQNKLFFEAYKRVPKKPGLPGLIEALKKN
jgi:hypothetical protein